jgi:DNA-binding transcriptional LysR family regulator
MDLNHLQVFVAVADEGSFSRAAEALGLAKSTVSERVRALEDQLAAQLFARSTRQVSLTDAGQLLLRRARDIIALAAQAESELTATTGRAIGTLRMSAPISFGLRFMTGMVAELARDHPLLRLDFQLEDRTVDLLVERFDLAIRIGRLPDSSLVVRKVGTSRRLVVASPAYLARYGAPNTPLELQERECLLYTHQQDADTWLFDEPGGSERRVRVHGRIRSNHGDALATLASEGAGIAWLPEFIVTPFIEQGQLVPLLPQHCIAEMPIHVVFPPRARRSYKEELVVSALQRRLTG